MAAFTSAALASEIANNPANLSDPISGLTITQLAAKGLDTTVASVLNTVQPGASFLVFNPTLPTATVTASINATDFAAMTQLQVSKLQLLLGASGTVDATNANNQANVLAQIPNGAGSQTALAAAAKRQGSRMEVVFFPGFSVTAQQCGQAR